jgi:rhodanese-related sulfurtransferase
MLTSKPVDSFRARVEEHPECVLDVRTPGEFAQGHIGDAVNIDYMDPSFVEKMKELPREAPYSIYCRSGGRSAQALLMMESLGFTDVMDLAGGTIAWQSAGHTLRS